jgi:hypothetical protein
MSAPFSSRGRIPIIKAHLTPEIIAQAVGQVPDLPGAP